MRSNVNRAEFRSKLEELEKQRENMIRECEIKQNEIVRTLLQIKDKAAITHKILQDKIAKSFNFTDLEEFTTLLYEMVNSE